MSKTFVEPSWRLFARRGRPLAAAAVLALSACSTANPPGVSSSGASDVAGVTESVGSEDDASQAPADAADEESAVPVTAADTPRPVPTVPADSGADGEAVGEADDGVIDGVPTIAPPPPPSIDPDTPLTTLPPPTTEFVGDLAPNPESTAPPPPPPLADEPAVCDLLTAFEVVAIVADIGGVGVDGVAIDGEGDLCRYIVGDASIQVFRVSEASIVDDWYRRSGIEPVGEVGGEAVGLPAFVTPTGATGAGYTIALTSGRRGIVVAAETSSDGRLFAAEVAIVAAQAI